MSGVILQHGILLQLTMIFFALHCLGSLGFGLSVILRLTSLNGSHLSIKTFCGGSGSSGSLSMTTFRGGGGRSLPGTVKILFKKNKFQNLKIN